MDQELLTLSEHHTPRFNGVIFFVLFLVRFLCSVLWTIVCFFLYFVFVLSALSDLRLLTNVSSTFHFLSNFDLENNSALNYGLFRYNLFYYPVCVCGFKCANLFTAFLDCLSNISIYYQLINVHQEWTTQKHWQHCAHKEQDENKQEFIINTKHFD